MKKRFTYLLILSFCLVTLSYGQFTQVTGVTGGRIRALAAKDSYVFAGIEGSGSLYRSTDSGSTWNLCQGFPTDVSVLSVKYLGNDVYCGTMSGSAFKSTDNGNTWNEIIGAPITGTYIQDFLTDGTRIYMASNYVCISTDNGATWTRSNTGMTSSGVNKMLFVGTKLFIGVQNGVFVSADNGATWAPANTGISDKTIYSLGYDGTALYAGTYGAIYKSTDEGATWVPDINGLNSDNSYVSFMVIGTKIFVAAYGSSIPLFSREISSNTWDNAFTGILSSGGYSLTKNDSYYFLGTAGGGVYRSNDNGATWIQYSTGLAAADIRSLYVDESHIYVAAYQNGFFKSNDEGTTWGRINNGITGYWSNGIYASGANAFAATTDKIYMSTDGGENWLVSYSNSGAYCISGKGNTILAGSWSGIIRSTDNGSSWTAISAGFASEAINIIIFAGSNAYALSRSNVYHSTDDGLTWTTSVSGLPVSDNLISITAMDNYIFVGTWGGIIFRSQDNGSSWTEVGNSGGTIKSLMAYNNTIYAGLSGNNILRSNNLGASFSSFATGIKVYSFNNCLARNENYMFVGTSSSGVYRIPLSEVIVANEKEAALPNSYSLEQNYPNPFNPSTTIKYTIPSVETRHASSLQQHVTLKVYDLLGREIATLVNGGKSAGVHSVQFDGSNLPSGIYIYKIQAGEWSLSKKMIFIK